MEETHEGARARRALRTHIGALYSCPTNVPVPRVREDNLRELSLKRPDGSTYCFERLRYTPYSSARCLVRQAPVQSSSNCCASSGSGEPPTNEYPAPSNDYAPAKADDASIIEVFCRVLPLRTLPAHTLALSGSGRNLVPAFAPASPRHGTGGADERNANTDALLESLGTMYKGLQVVGSPPQASIAAGPGTTCEDGDESVGSSAAAATAAADAAGTTAVSSVAAQPVGLARPLATCARLHAGLVPLFAPVVESRDDVFLVRFCRCWAHVVRFGGMKLVHAIILILVGAKSNAWSPRMTMCPWPINCCSARVPYQYQVPRTITADCCVSYRLLERT